MRPAHTIYLTHESCKGPKCTRKLHKLIDSLRPKTESITLTDYTTLLDECDLDDLGHTHLKLTIVLKGKSHSFIFCLLEQGYLEDVKWWIHLAAPELGI